MSKERDEFYFNIFVTALEGGIGYWSQCEKYHWCLDSKNPKVTDNEDLQGFEARIIEVGDGDEAVKHTINRAVIVKGINALAKGTATYGGRAMEPRAVAYYAKILRTLDEAGDVDSGIADNIVQAGLFNDVRYG